MLINTNNNHGVANTMDSQYYLKKLLKDRERILESEKQLEFEALKELSLDGMNEISHLPFHLADLGTLAQEQDRNIRLTEFQLFKIHEIDDAIERVHSNKYGICQSCQSEIPEVRLEVIPETKLCGACKTQLELQNENQKRSFKKSHRNLLDRSSDRAEDPISIDDFEN
jgi:RNA polymerase-binding transcription factor DksA